MPDTREIITKVSMWTKEGTLDYYIATRYTTTKTEKWTTDQMGKKHKIIVDSEEADTHVFKTEEEARASFNQPKIEIIHDSFK